MRVEFGTPASDEVVARADESLPAGEIAREGNELRVGAPEGWGLDGLRAAAAYAARTLRGTGGRIAWRAESPGDARAIVEGIAFGAYDAGLRKRGYDERPELTLVLDADGDA